VNEDIQEQWVAAKVVEDLKDLTPTAGALLLVGILQQMLKEHPGIADELKPELRKATRR
jgi:hypothetical protein